MALSTKSLVSGSNYNPYDNRDVGDGGTSNFQTMIHLLKGAIGTGILAMPMAFNNSGWVLGLPLTLLIAALCCYGILVLIRCQFLLCKRKEVGFLTYPQVMKEALMTGPSCMGCLVPVAVPFVDSFLVVYQIGICAVYVIFMGSNLMDVVNYYCNIDWDIRIYELIVFLPCVGIMFVKNLRVLSPFAFLANILTFVGLAIILYYSFSGLPPIGDATKIGKIKNMPAYVSAVLFALEAVGVMLAVQSKMTHPESFTGSTGILAQSLAISGILYAFVGCIGYLKYRDTVKGSITLNLPDNEALANATKMMYSFAIFISYGLQGFVPFDILWNNYLKPRWEHLEHTDGRQFILRFFIVLVSFIMAVAIPDIGYFISFIGALCLSMLGFTFPAVIEICVLHPDRHGTCKIMLVKNILLILFGFAVLVLGVSLTVVEIVANYH